MNIYLLEANFDTGWDEYDAFVVIARDSGHARRLMIRGKWQDDDTHSGADGKWRQRDKVTCTKIGVAAEGQSIGIVLGSFNAG